MPPVAKVQQIHELVAEIATIVSRTRAVITDQQQAKREGHQDEIQRLAIIHACEPGKNFNRSYQVSARGHAVGVLQRREGITAEAASQAWGLMRDLYELHPFGRFCAGPDAAAGAVFQPDGLLVRAGHPAPEPIRHVAQCLAQIKQLVPTASRIDFAVIRGDRQRVFVEVVDLDEGLLLATDLAAITDLLNRLVLGEGERPGAEFRDRAQHWRQRLGVEGEQELITTLSLLATLCRLGPVDSCVLPGAGTH